MKYVVSAVVIVVFSVVAWLALTDSKTISSTTLTVGASDNFTFSAPVSDDTTLTMTVPPILSEQLREQTAQQRREALPIVLKVANESIARLQEEIEMSKALGVPETEIAEKEQQLQDMQELLQRVLVRNADVRT